MVTNDGRDELGDGEDVEFVDEGALSGIVDIVALEISTSVSVGNAKDRTGLVSVTARSGASGVYSIGVGVGVVPAGGYGHQ